MVPDGAEGGAEDVHHPVPEVGASQRDKHLVIFVGRAVGAGQQQRERERGVPTRALAEKGTTQQDRQPGVLERVQQLVPDVGGDEGHRVRLRRQVENQRHVGERRQPQARPDDQTAAGH